MALRYNRLLHFRVPLAYQCDGPVHYLDVPVTSMGGDTSEEVTDKKRTAVAPFHSFINTNDSGCCTVNIFHYSLPKFLIPFLITFLRISMFLN